MSPHQRVIHIPSNSLIVKHHRFLKKLASTENPAHLIRKAKASELKALTEIAQNLLRNNYPVSGKRFIQRLAPYKGLIRKLAQPKRSIKEKKTLLLNQKGGLPFLVPLLTPIIGSLIAAAISK